MDRGRFRRSITDQFMDPEQRFARRAKTAKSVSFLYDVVTQWRQYGLVKNLTGVVRNYIQSYMVQHGKAPPVNSLVNRSLRSNFQTRLNVLAWSMMCEPKPGGEK
jgi:hypothetical protein